VNYHHRAADAEHVVALIHQPSGRALAVQADVGDAAQVRSIAERIASELGPIDILINNAGDWPRATWRISTTRKWKLCGAPTWTV
jgi:3-oxoacyl-[acyl-carrier protein] reductase